jgi:flagellar hook assembly protein FlgD
MAIIPTIIPESNILLIGTRSSGVIGYSFPSTSVGNDLTPGSHKLENNYPNPFNPSTTIRYTIGGLRQVFVKLLMYDALGRDVKTIVSSRQGPGTYEATWDGTDDAGIRLASGTYLSRLLVGSSVSSHTVLLLK